MKALLILLTLCVASNISAQTTNFTFTLKIKNTQNRPMPNVVVTAVNASTELTLTAKTNVDGKAVFTLTEPGNYSFSYLEMKDVCSAEVKEGFSGTFMRSATYDPKGVFAEKPTVDRKGIVFKTVPGRQLRGKDGVAKVIVNVKKTNRTAVPNVEVKLVSFKDKTKYTGESNAYGQAIFYVPINQDYEIDVANLEGYKTFNVPNYSGLELQQFAFYEKTKVRETAKGDTLIQNSVVQKAGTSSHVLFTLTLKDYDGNALPDEPVYLKAMSGPRVYEGVTDDQGKCALMVEKGDNYLLNLKHENNLLVIEAKSARGFKTESATRRYRGSDKIEALIAAQKAEMERIAKELEEAAQRAKERAEQIAQNGEIVEDQPELSFEISWEKTPVEKLEKPDNYLTKTADGFKINFEGSGRAATPTIVGNRMYMQEGAHSTNYYCLNATNGGFNWGLELSEGGISPAVYQNGVILINTASCSLYAIDAITGELLWSKWLAGYLYSTPTADDDNVYVVYQHGGRPVTVSFGLKTGKFNWMQLVDNEVIACPVIEGNEVHVASQSGTYYVFDKKKGTPIITSDQLKVVSSPTITEDKIYVTIELQGYERLAELDRKTLKIEKTYPASLTSLKISGDRRIDETDQMNFNGSHPIVYQNRVLIVTDANQIMAFDIASEKLIWKQSVRTNSDQLPIVANNKVIITSTDGRVMSYDLKDGTPKQLRKVEGEIEGQPIAKNGFLYIAVGGIIQVFKNAAKYDFGQWNKDGGHNTVWR